VTTVREEHSVQVAGCLAIAHGALVAAHGLVTELAARGYVSRYFDYIEPWQLWYSLGWQTSSSICAFEILAGLGLVKGYEVARRALKAYAILGSVVCAFAVGFVLFFRPFSMSGSTSPYAYGPPIGDEYPHRFKFALVSTITQTALYVALTYLVSRRAVTDQVKRMAWQRANRRLERGK
jgi:hypothetical protein